MNRLITRLTELRARQTQGGFSLIDVVVTVAIIVALTVGGFIAYGAIVNQAKQGAVDYAASNVYRSALVYENDSDSSTNACSAIDEYNSNSDGIAVSLLVPANATQGPDDAPTYFGKGNAKNTYTC